MTSALLDPSNWGLWAYDHGRLVVGFGGLELILAVFAWLFAQMGYYLFFSSYFGVARSEAEATLTESAHFLFFSVGALAWLMFTVVMLSGFSIISIVIGVAIWLGGGNVLVHFGDRLPGIGSRLAPAVNALRLQRGINS